MIISENDFRVVAAGYIALIDGDDPSDYVFSILKKYGIVDENNELIYEEEI